MKTKKQRDLLLTLQQFYQQPVAKVSLELFFSIGAVLFFAIFAIRPTLLTMSELIKEIEDKEKLDQQLSQKIAALSTVQPLYLQLQYQLSTIDEAVPSSPQLIHSLKIIERMASDLDLVIMGMGVAEVPNEQTPTDMEGKSLASFERIDIPITISVSGDYPTIRQFIENLKGYRRSFVIDTIIFATKEIRGDKKLEARITVSIPYFGINQLETGIK
jgi:hypothetical protein